MVSVRRGGECWGEGMGAGNAQLREQTAETEGFPLHTLWCSLALAALSCPYGMSHTPSCLFLPIWVAKASRDMGTAQLVAVALLGDAAAVPPCPHLQQGWGWQQALTNPSPPPHRARCPRKATASLSSPHQSRVAFFISFSHPSPLLGES